MSGNQNQVATEEVDVISKRLGKILGTRLDTDKVLKILYFKLIVLIVFFFL